MVAFGDSHDFRWSKGDSNRREIRGLRLLCVQRLNQLTRISPLAMVRR